MCDFAVNMNSLPYSSVSFFLLLLYFPVAEVTILEGSYFFYQQPEYPRDCKEVYAHCSSHNSSGIYTIKPDGYSKPFEVYCNNQVSPGGWTVIQRQMDGSLTFKRNWGDYRSGFGFLSSEFYIGNDKLSYLTNQAVYELRIDMILSNGSHFYVKYNSFRISDEWSQYALVNVEEFSGNSSCIATSCPTNMVHESCTCQTSCRDPNGMTDCREVCVETCVPKRCFVTETNSFILEGKNYTAPGCSKRCFCADGQLTCDNTYRCHVNAVCERREDDHQCYCNPGYSGDGVTECVSFCQTNEVYGTCTCQKSCRNPAGCVACRQGEGCYCPNEFYLQGGDCVRQEECGCFVDGNIIPEGESYTAPGCTKRCSCNNGQLTCNNNYRCHVNAVCESRDSERKCYCFPGYSGDGVTCVSICQTNEIYGTCTCQKSCRNPSGCVSCSQGERCYCPNGFYIQGGDCVRQEECGCFFDGSIIPNGETYVNSGCSRSCTCNNDRLNCDSNYRCHGNAACRVHNGRSQCLCNTGYEGDGVTSCTPVVYTDCNDVQNAGHTRSGVYSIRPIGWSGSPFNVFCNLTIDGGGWTVFQRRVNGSTSFYRNWADYKNGFGNIQQEFWLGNEKLYNLTQQATYEYRLDFVTSSHSSYHNTYSRFRIDNESNKYRVIDVGSRSGTRGKSLHYTQNRDFSTHDQDNDGLSYDCAEKHRSGWWHGGYYFYCYYSYCHLWPDGSLHRACSESNLNGDYNGGDGQNIFSYNYFYCFNSDCQIKYTEMKIRRIS